MKRASILLLLPISAILWACNQPLEAQPNVNNTNPPLVALGLNARIQFEDFKQGGEGVAYHDNDPQNQGGFYRPSEGVDIDQRGDAEGYAIGWSGQGEWMKYDLNVATAGRFDLSIRYGTWKAGEALDVFVDDTKVLSAQFPNIGTLDNHQVIKAGTVSLTAGAHVVKVAYVGVNPAINLDWMEFVSVGGSDPAPPPPSPIPPTPAPGARQLYVSPSGDNNNLGTLGQPFRTIQKAVDSAAPGTEVLLRGGTYAETVNIRNSGSASGGYVTLRSYPGERGVIDGQNLSLSRGQALLTINEQQYVRVANITIQNAFGVLPFAVAINGASHHVEFRDSTVTNIVSGSMWARGITINNARADAPMYDILIENNDISKMRNTPGEVIAIGGNTINSRIVGNRLSDFDYAIGIDVLGNYDEIDDPSVGFARDIVVSDNVLRPGNHTPQDYENICLYVDGGSRTTFERNKMYGCRNAIQINSEAASVVPRDNIVRDNLAVDCTYRCLIVGGWPGSSYATSENTLISNNTFVLASNAPYHTVLLNRANNTRLVNNIIVGGGQPMLVLQGANGVTANNNLWFGTGGGAQGTNSLFVDPLFANPSGADYSLQAGSPAINRGDPSVISTGERDVDGNPRQIGRVDIGAYER